MSSLAIRAIAFACLTILSTGLLALPYLTITPGSLVAEARSPAN